MRCPLPDPTILPWITTVLMGAGWLVSTAQARIAHRGQAELRARAEVTFDLTLSTQLYTPAGGSAVLVSSHLDVVSRSSEVHVVLGAYIEALPAPLQAPRSFVWEELERLDKVGALAPVDCARKVGPNSLVQIAPGERESFARWDVISRDTATKFPVMIFRGIVYVGPFDLLRPRDNVRGVREGAFRTRWLGHLAQTKGGWIPFKRSDDTNSNVIIDSEGRTDAEASGDFAPLLEVVSASSTFTTLVLKP